MKALITYAIAAKKRINSNKTHYLAVRQLVDMGPVETVDVERVFWTVDENIYYKDAEGNFYVNLHNSVTCSKGSFHGQLVKWDKIEDRPINIKADIINGEPAFSVVVTRKAEELNRRIYQDNKVLFFGYDEDPEFDSYALVVDDNRDEVISFYQSVLPEIYQGPDGAMRRINEPRMLLAPDTYDRKFVEQGQLQYTYTIPEYVEKVSNEEREEFENLFGYKPRAFSENGVDQRLRHNIYVYARENSRPLTVDYAALEISFDELERQVNRMKERIKNPVFHENVSRMLREIKDDLYKNQDLSPKFW